MGAATDGRSGISFTAALATQELRKANKLERRQAVDVVDARFKAQEAAQSRADGQRILAPLPAPIGDASLELVPPHASYEAQVSDARLHVLATLDEPDVISVDASEHRAHAATRAGVLSAALDAAVSVPSR